jgi:predicted acyl esterase
LREGEMLAMKRTLTLIAAVGMLAIPGMVPTATALPHPDGDHYQYYFPSLDGTYQLHADVLRPKGFPNYVRTPVILTVSPYTNHNGATTDTDLNGVGPSPRFYDFLNLSGALRKGYTYVMVDLPGFGGSGGCNDWGGVREQQAVKAAVEWAASRSWSNGKVALLGKSYDGWTGLMGIAQQPRGLSAVVSLEPVYDGYRYIWMNGIRRSGTVGTITLFQAIDAKPGRPNDDPEYLANSGPNVWCYPVNIVGAGFDDNANGPFWQERNLVPTTAGKTTPVFLTQGFLETNTQQDGAFIYWNGLAGNENRAWFGQFDHCRGWETEGACTNTTDAAVRNRLAVGREGFITEVMSFLDEHLKGIQPQVDYPTIAVQDILGRYRAEEDWPPVDSIMYETSLNIGSYTDNGSGSGLRPTEGQGIWSVSQPLPHDVWLSGEPEISVQVNTLAPNANMAANVYDIGPDGRVLMISRGVNLLRGIGARGFTFSLYGHDFPIPAGHRIGVLIGSGNTDVFTHVPTQQSVSVLSASVRLPFLTYDRTMFLDGGSTPRLERYLGAARNTLSAAKIASSQRTFNIPGPLLPPP